MMAYHSIGLGKNKAIKKERNKPLPMALMKNDKTNRPRTNQRRDTENNIDSKDFQGSEYYGMGY